jgi:hypothetical protein
MIHRISLSKDAARKIAAAAHEGYHAPYKQERLGILLGYVSGGCVHVEQAVVYRGGTRTRSAANYDSSRLEARIKDLQKETGWKFLGGFHTHNEEAGTISSAMSKADKEPLCDNLPALVEIIACIWASDSHPRESKDYLQCKLGDYRIRIAGYACQQKFQRLKVSSRATLIRMG